MMREEDRAVQVGRRAFLKQAGIAVGAAGAAVLSAGDTAVAGTRDADVRTSGYRETEHVRTYYELARF